MHTELSTAPVDSFNYPNRPCQRKQMPRTMIAGSINTTHQSSCILRPPLTRCLLLSIVSQAGWPIWPLLALSVAGLAIIIERFLSLQPARIAPPDLTRQVIQLARAQADDEQALEKLSASSPLGQILAQLLNFRDLPDAELRACVEDVGQEIAHDLTRFLPALAMIATVAPLMGLFGTVIGMIEIFAAYRPDGSDPTELARGISIALYNTGFGILIAVPALIAHRYFKSRVDNLLMVLEKSARQVRESFWT